MTHERTTAAALSEEVRKAKQKFTSSQEDDDKELAELVDTCAAGIDPQCALLLE